MPSTHLSGGFSIISASILLLVQLDVVGLANLLQLSVYFPVDYFEAVTRGDLVFHLQTAKRTDLYS